jgi:hypothetical protein
MEPKLDRYMDTAAFIAAIEQNRLEMEEAYQRAANVFIARELAREVKRRLKAANFQTAAGFSAYMRRPKAE